MFSLVLLLSRIFQGWLSGFSFGFTCSNCKLLFEDVQILLPIKQTILALLPFLRIFLDRVVNFLLGLLGKVMVYSYYLHFGYKLIKSLVAEEMCKEIIIVFTN
jgi:hypothetical protein